MRRLAALFGLAAAVAIASWSPAFASTRYDPRLRFRTISTARFDIHYHQGEEDQARRLAQIAETVARELDSSLGQPSGRVQVILVAQSDLSNGWATPLPYNTIEITAAAPAADSIIGNTSDWLRTVFTHEYTHIVHLSRGRGWIGGLRRGFGRMPLLFPNIYLPLWQVEGIATYQESASTGEGRVRDTSFRAILDVAAGTSRFDPIDRANGGLVDWPGGHAPYLYGAFFHAYLARKYGDATLGRLTDETARRIPYLGSPAFKKVFDQSLGDLWRDYESAASRPIPVMSSSVQRLTHHGFVVSGARTGPDGRLYYSIVNPHGFPSLMVLGSIAAEPVKVGNRYLGGSFGFGPSSIVFDQIDIENQVGLQSDLYAIGTDGSRTRRLTRGARAGYPDVAPNGTTIVCTIQQTDRRALAVIELAGGRASPPRILFADADTDFASPRWSPDGRLIAVQRGASGIAVIDPATQRMVRMIAATNGARLVNPAWQSNDVLMFASDRGGNGFQIHRIDLRTGSASVLEGAGPDARAPEIARDGGRLYFVGYTSDGYDLFSLPTDSARWSDLGNAFSVTTSLAAPTLSSSGGTTSSRSYSPWKTIAPRFWTPTIFSDNDEWLIGAATGSEDVLGRHVYAAQAAWTSSRNRPDWQVAYAYDRWWPTVFANYSDDTDPFRNAEIRTREANAGVLLPFRRIRWTQTILGAFHSSSDEVTCPGCEPADIRRRSLRTGWRMSAARGYGYSISLEEGWSATTGIEFTREAWGSRGGGAATIDLRGYLPVAPRHAVIAMRAAGATTWGDEAVRRVFSASGYDALPGGFRFGSDAIGLIRGVNDDEVFGHHAAVVNLDYRVPLLRIDRGWGTVPVLARAIHAAVFADVGQAWEAHFDASDAIASLGAELSIDAVVGFRLPLTFTAGGAWISQDRGFAVFGRVGRAF